MSKVFISQPMSGKSEEQILKERQDAMIKLMSIYPDKEIEVIDSYIEETPDKKVKNDGVWYLGVSILLLSQAEVAYFMKGWDDARGCILEHNIAVAYGIPTIEE